MTVYVELVLIENFIVDVFLLLGSARITGAKAHHPYLAGLFGAFYALLLPVLPMPKASVLLALFGMCAICFTLEKLSFIYPMIAVIFESSALYGIANLIFGGMSEGMFYSDNILFTVALCSCALAYGMLCLLKPFMRAKKTLSNTLTFTVYGKSFKAFIGLYYRDMPVVLICTDKQIEEECLKKPLIIPFTTVNSTGAMLGFIPKAAYITYNEKTEKVHCVIAISQSKFNADFEVLMHPDLVRECV